MLTFLVEGDSRGGMSALSLGIDRLLADLKSAQDNWNAIKDEMIEEAKPASNKDSSMIPNLTSFFSFSGSIPFATASTTAPVAEPKIPLTNAEEQNIILQKIRKLKQQNENDLTVEGTQSPDKLSAPSEQEVCYSCRTFMIVFWL